MTQNPSFREPPLLGPGDAVGSAPTLAALQPGQPVQGLYLVQQKRAETSRAGAPYLALVLTDRSGRIDGRVWDLAERYGALFEAGDVLFVEGLAELYKGSIQLRIRHLERVAAETVDLSQLLPASRFDPEVMWTALVDLVHGEIRDERVRRVLLGVLADPEVATGLRRAPAAKGNHHAFVAGLLEHTLSVCQLALRVGQHYEPLYGAVLDPDLLVAGAMLHDLGKVWELGIERRLDYTDPGRLLGHVALGLRLLDGVLEAEGLAGTELALRLEHMVLSHHGELEFGAVVKPQTPEAQVLHFIDQIDARLNMMAQALEGCRGNWSEWVPPLRRTVYAGERPSAKRDATPPLVRDLVAAVPEQPEPAPEPVTERLLPPAAPAAEIPPIVRVEQTLELFADP